MKGIMSKSQLTIVKEYEFSKPLIHKTDSIIDNCYRNCHNIYYHTFEYFEYKCEYDIKLTNITDIEIKKITISEKSSILYDINNKLKVVRQNGFIFNQIIKLTIKFHSHLRYKNVSCYLKFRIPMCHRHIFRNISQNRKYISNFSNNDKEKPFNYAIRK